ncbi:hypothetical protein ACWDBD_17530 [Streptomyces sp. NPDC001118]
MLDYLDDIASDMSVFHRIDDVTALDGPTFFKLAWRLPAYTGVMQARALAESEPSSPAQPATQQPFTYGGAARQDINPGTKATLMAEPAFAGVFSFG